MVLSPHRTIDIVQGVHLRPIGVLGLDPARQKLRTVGLPPLNEEAKGSRLLTSRPCKRFVKEDRTRGGVGVLMPESLLPLASSVISIDYLPPWDKVDERGQVFGDRGDGIALDILVCPGLGLVCSIQ